VIKREFGVGYHQTRASRTLKRLVWVEITIPTSRQKPGGDDRVADREPHTEVERRYPRRQTSSQKPPTREAAPVRGPKVLKSLS
jgi:hypothetical protein